jgi:excisionase family DNA binding protein
MVDHHLLTAADLESQYNLRRGTTYRAAKRGLIPSYRVGLKGRGVRFRPDEVLAALRNPAGAPSSGFESIGSILPRVLNDIAAKAQAASGKDDQ